MQREGKGADDPDAAGGSVYLRLSTRTIEQIPRAMTPQLASDITRGAYWLRPPGPNCEVVIAYTGAVAPEAIEAAGLMGEDRRDVGLLAITSADRLYAGHSHARRMRSQSHVDAILAGAPRHCALVTVTDGHPAALAWLGGVHGHRTASLGVDAFGQSAAIGDLYGHFGIDVNGILAAAEEASEGRPLRHRKSILAA
jgi:pyruvate dehydrogenase E1 component